MRHVDNSVATPERIASFLKELRKACESSPDPREQVSRLKEADWSCTREHLMQLSHFKCWYSEKPVDPNFHDRFVVSHHWPVHDAESTTDYKEHAFDLKNLRFVFRQCDSRRRNFQDYNKFLLRDGIEEEEPILLDPTNASDPRLLAFRADGSIVPANPNPALWKYKRARHTIDAMGLDLNSLLQDRLLVYTNANEASHDIMIAMFWKNLKEKQKLKLKSKKTEDAIERLVGLCNPKAAYSSVAKSAATNAFSTAPDYLDYQAREWPMPQWWADMLVALG